MNKNAARLGFYSALISSIAALGYSVSQILQVLNIIQYPLDDILIFGFSLAISSPFLLAMLALHYSVAPEKKIWSNAAVLFSVIYVTFVSLVYIMQLGSVIPYSPDARNTTAIASVNPHSLFWTLDGCGYIFMGIATLLAVPAFEKKGIQRWLRMSFIANATVTIPVAFVYFSPHFSNALLMIAGPWCITLPGSTILLTMFFKKASLCYPICQLR